jgi:ATP-dependent DNA ligase
MLPLRSRLNEKDLEGIIAKRKGSTYQPGRRSPDWLKIKARPQQEFVVGGFTEGKGAENILERCFWARTETASSVTSDIQEAVSLKKD